MRRHLSSRLAAAQPGQRQGLHACRRVLVLRAVRRPLSHRRRDRQHALFDPLRKKFMMKTTPRSMSPPPRLCRLAALAAGLVMAASGCSRDAATPSSGNVVNVVIGYQSKTINTVTAGTLLRAQGYLERRLADITTRTGTKYNVTWQDYDTGAPITAQMVAEKIDIGSMGDYPMLINGSKTQANKRAVTEIVSVTGYNPKGALNMVVVAPNSPAQKLTDLAGQKVSASVGSAGHGTLVRALASAGIDPKTGAEGTT